MNRIRINGKDWDAVAAESQKDFFKLPKKMPWLFGERAYQVYTYDCRLGEKGNTAPSPIFSAQVSPVFWRFKKDSSGNPTDVLDPQARAAALRDFFRGGIVTGTKDLLFQVNKDFPPVSFAVPFQALHKKMGSDSRYVVFAWISNRTVWLKPVRSNGAGFFLSFPYNAWFVAVQYGWCAEDGDETDRKLKIWRTDSTPPITGPGPLSDMFDVWSSTFRRFFKTRAEADRYWDAGIKSTSMNIERETARTQKRWVDANGNK